LIESIELVKKIPLEDPIEFDKNTVEFGIKPILLSGLIEASG
jgi:hypothetical protein